MPGMYHKARRRGLGRRESPIRYYLTAGLLDKHPLATTRILLVKAQPVTRGIVTLAGNPDPKNREPASEAALAFLQCASRVLFFNSFFTLPVALPSPTERGLSVGAVVET